MTKGDKGAIIAWIVIVAAIVVLALMSVGCSAPRQDFQPLSIRRDIPPPPMAAPAAAPVQGKSVKLAWDAPASGVVGFYRMYQGGQSRNYTNSVTGTAGTTLTMAGLVPKATYYFAVTAVDSAGLESTYSNEVSYRVPASRAKLTTQTTIKLETGLWTSIATNYDETVASSGFYRLLIDYEE